MKYSKTRFFYIFSIVIIPSLIGIPKKDQDPCFSLRHNQSIGIKVLTLTETKKHISTKVDWSIEPFLHQVDQHVKLASKIQPEYTIKDLCCMNQIDSKPKIITDVPLFIEPDGKHVLITEYQYSSDLTLSKFNPIPEVPTYVSFHEFLKSLPGIDQQTKSIEEIKKRFDQLSTESLIEFVAALEGNIAITSRNLNEVKSFLVELKTSRDFQAIADSKKIINYLENHLISLQSQLKIAQDTLKNWQEKNYNQLVQQPFDYLFKYKDNLRNKLEVKERSIDGTKLVQKDKSYCNGVKELLQQVEGIIYLKDVEGQNFTRSDLLISRQVALKASDAVPRVLTQEAITLIQANGFEPKSFIPDPSDTPLQRHSANEVIDTINKTAHELNKTNLPKNYDIIIPAIMKSANISMKANKKGDIEKGWLYADLATKIFDLVKSGISDLKIGTYALGRGIQKGTANTLHAIANPIETSLQMFVTMIKIAEILDLADGTDPFKSLLPLHSEVTRIEKSSNQFAEGIVEGANAISKMTPAEFIEGVSTKLTEQAFFTGVVHAFKHLSYFGAARYAKALKKAEATKYTPALATRQNMSASIDKLARAIEKKVGGGQKLNNKNIGTPKTNLKYENAPYHHINSKGEKSLPPRNGQKALDKSIPYKIKPTGLERRLAIEGEKFVILDESSKGVFHGHLRDWRDLNEAMQTTLREANLTNYKGKILIK